MTEDIRLLWDFPVQTDNRLQHNRPDIVFENKKDRSCLLINISCPFDTRIERKEKEQIEVYQDLKREIRGASKGGVVGVTAPALFWQGR